MNLEQIQNCEDPWALDELFRADFSKISSPILLEMSVDDALSLGLALQAMLDVSVCALCAEDPKPIVKTTIKNIISKLADISPAAARLIEISENRYQLSD